MFKDYLHLHFIIFLWGFTGLVGKWTSFSYVELVWYRTLFALPLLYFLLRRRKLGGPQTPRRGVEMLLSGFFVAAHWISFFAAIQLSTVSICLIGLASTAFWTAILQPLFFRQAWRWQELLVGGIVVAGMASVSQFEPQYFLGLSLSLLSAFCASTFTLLNARFMQKGEQPLRITFFQMSGAFGFTSLFLVLGSFLGFSFSLVPTASWWQDGALIVFLAWVCTVYAYVAAVELMRRISPFIINLSVNMEPVYGILAAMLLLQEHKKLTPQFYGSTLLIMLCVLLYPVLMHLAKKKPSKQSAKQTTTPVSEKRLGDEASKPWTSH